MCFVQHARRFGLFALATCCEGFSATDSGVFATTQVVGLSGGVIRVPPNTTELLVEIGCSDFHTLDEDELDLRPGAFLVAFEPMLDKYAVLLARGSERMVDREFPAPGGPGRRRQGEDQAIPLGHHHRRGVVLPLAVSVDGGPTQMRVTKVAGCSSLLSPKLNAEAGAFIKNRKIR